MCRFHARHEAWLQVWSRLSINNLHSTNPVHALGEDCGQAFSQQFGHCTRGLLYQFWYTNWFVWVAVCPSLINQLTCCVYVYTYTYAHAQLVRIRTCTLYTHFTCIRAHAVPKYLLEHFSCLFEMCCWTFALSGLSWWCGTRLHTLDYLTPRAVIVSYDHLIVQGHDHLIVQSAILGRRLD